MKKKINFIDYKNRCSGFEKNVSGAKGILKKNKIKLISEIIFQNFEMTLLRY